MPINSRFVIGHDQKFTCTQLAANLHHFTTTFALFIIVGFPWPHSPVTNFAGCIPGVAIKSEDSVIVPTGKGCITSSIFENQFSPKVVPNPAQVFAAFPGKVIAG